MIARVMVDATQVPGTHLEPAPIAAFMVVVSLVTPSPMLLLVGGLHVYSLD
jgi:hypothetical protein